MPRYAPWARCPSLLLALGACVSLVSCLNADRPPVEIRLGVSPTPATVGQARVIVTLSGLDGDAAPQVSIVGTPPSDADGEPSEHPLRWAQRIPNGDYVISAFPFDMSGEWRLTVQVTLDDGQRANRSFPVRVVGPLEPEPGG